MSKRNRSQSTEVFSKNYLGVYMENNMNPSLKIHTFQIFATKESWDGKNDFLLFEDLDFHNRSRFSEIVQRSININRVKKEIKKGYLEQGEQHVKYFPPIIAVLLPVSEEHGLKSQYEDSTDELHRLGIDGVKVGVFDNNAWKKTEELNTGDCLDVAWDKNKYKAIVIDGQHRLASLRAHGKSVNLAINLIVFDKEVPNLNLIKLTREIFINVNNNAVSVSDTKLILMDDKNISRVSTIMSIIQPNYELKDNSEWKPLNSVIEKETVDNFLGIPQQLLMFPGEKEENEISDILLGQLDPKSYGPSCITSLILIHKFINDFMKGSCFEEYCRLYDDLSSTEIESEIERLFSEEVIREYSEFKNIKRTNEILKKFCDDPILQKYMEYCFFCYYESDEEGEGGSDLDEFEKSKTLYSYESTQTKEIAVKMKPELVDPLVNIFIKLKWSNQIMNSFLNFSREISDITSGQKIFHDFVLRTTRSSAAPEIENFVAEYSLNAEDKNIVEKKLAEFLNSLKDDKINNVFRTSVGQRALFMVYKEKELYHPVLSHISELSNDLTNDRVDRMDISNFLANLINTLDEKVELSKRDCSLEISCLNQDLKYYLWEEILIGDPGEAKRMKPQLINAKRAATLFLYLGGVDLSKGITKSVRKILGNVFLYSSDISKVVSELRQLFPKDEEPTAPAIEVTFMESVVRQKSNDQFLKSLHKQRSPIKSYDDILESGARGHFQEVVGTLLLDSLRKKLHG